MADAVRHVAPALTVKLVPHEIEEQRVLVVEVPGFLASRPFSADGKYYVADVITRHLASDAVEAVLAADRPLSVTEASELLRDHPRLPIRTEGVFFARLVELFEELRDGTRSDTALVMDRDRSGGDKPGHEVYLLQAYLHRRIEDRWASASTTRRLVWSPMDDAQSIPDFLAQLGRMKIPVEVKWSHHPHVKTASRTQLAEGYCARAGRSFGVYVVARSTRTSDDAEWGEIAAALEQTRHDLRPAVHIANVFLDFRPYAPASQASRGTPSDSHGPAATRKATQEASRKSQS